MNLEAATYIYESIFLGILLQS